MIVGAWMAPPINIIGSTIVCAHFATAHPVHEKFRAMFTNLHSNLKSEWCANFM